MMGSIVTITAAAFMPSAYVRRPSSAGTSAASALLVHRICPVSYTHLTLPTNSRV